MTTFQAFIKRDGEWIPYGPVVAPTPYGAGCVVINRGSHNVVRVKDNISDIMWEYYSDERERKIIK